MPATASRLTFDGWIAGLGTGSGVRIVVGCWARSPFGAFTDVMVERPDGRRLLLAPTAEVGDFVAGTYGFDEVSVAPVSVAGADVQPGSAVSISARRLELQFRVGARGLLGQALRLVPAPLATSTAWSAAIDPVARLALPGVRTAGSAGNGRREWYGARDLHRVVAAGGTLDGQPLGGLAPVEPPVRFGFGSAPRRPSLVHVRSTVGPALP